MKKLYTMAVAALCSASVMAQTKTFSGETFVMPKVFTYDKNLRVVSVSEDGEVSVYDDDLYSVRSFHINVDGYEMRQEEQQRKAEVSVESTQVGGHMLVWETGEEWSGTWNQAKEWAKADVPNRGGEVEEKDNYQFWFTDSEHYWKYDVYGKAYPTTYYQWNAADGTISYTYITYKETYTGDWETVSQSSYSIGGLQSLHFEDYDSNSHPDQGFSLSQTLFNTDEKFE